MKLHSLTVERYRGFAKAVVIEFHDRLTLLIGENGAGKSSVLDALRVLLSQSLVAMRSKVPPKKTFDERDVANGWPYLRAQSVLHTVPTRAAITCDAQKYLSQFASRHLPNGSPYDQVIDTKDKYLVGGKGNTADHREMNSSLDPAVDRFAEFQRVDADEAELWRGKLTSFRDLYSFLSQIIPYQDSDLEKLYTYLRHLVTKLPKRGAGPQYNFDEEVRLEYYRLQKISEGSISLREGEARPLDGPKEVGTGGNNEEEIRLSRLIDRINERFGTEFTDADQLFFDQIAEAAIGDETLQQAAQVNPEDKFALVFNRVLESLFVERLEQNEEIFARFMHDPEFQSVIKTSLIGDVYRRLRATTEKLMAAEQGIQYLADGPLKTTP